MQIESVRAVARAAARSIGTVRGYVTAKRCRRCRHLLSKRAVVCLHCGRSQG